MLWVILSDYGHVLLARREVYRMKPGNLLAFLIVALVLTCAGTPAVAQTPAASQRADAGEARFAQLCSGCHGNGAKGGDRAPALAGNRSLRRRKEASIEQTIRNGTPSGMPAFPLPEAQLRELAHWVHSLNA